ncbi:hypothetical protein [Henriciella marina]|uniref:hypothetical protein n=1 Tax=Henriciella marina TaxID=453851 RepID=UPI0012E9B537|nr:hypothetical protein [Henriciella marina]
MDFVRAAVCAGALIDNSNLGQMAAMATSFDGAHISELGSFVKVMAGENWTFQQANDVQNVGVLCKQSSDQLLCALI